MSQSDLARASNITTAQISRIISGQRNPGKDALVSIAHALKLPPDMVFERAGVLPTKNELSERQKELLYLAENVDENDIDLAIAMLRAARDRRKNPATIK